MNGSHTGKMDQIGGENMSKGRGVGRAEGEREREREEQIQLQKWGDIRARLLRVGG